MNSTLFAEDFKKIITRILNQIPTFSKTNATIELLKSSIAVAISGALRVYIAALLLQTHVSALTCIAGGLIIYSVYTLDRALGSEEDLINRKELRDSKKEIGIAASVMAFLIGGYVLATEGILEFAFLPMIIGFLYSKGIKIGKCHLKLKGGIGSKNIVVGLIWGVSIVGVAGSTCNNILLLNLVFMFFGVKLFINSTIYDFKDIKGDTLAGIKTLPVSLGVRNTHNILIGLHMLSHLILGIALINGVLAFEPLIILYSFICGMICIQNYAKTDGEETSFQKFERRFLVDGESAVIVCLVSFINMIL